MIKQDYSKPRYRISSQQQHEKYMGLARDALSSGDRVGAENYFQHAEHFVHVMNEQINEKGSIPIKPIESIKPTSIHQTQSAQPERIKREVNHEPKPTYSTRPIGDTPIPRVRPIPKPSVSDPLPRPI